MKTIKEVLIGRDGMTAEEADEAIANTIEELQDLLTQGGSLGAAEDVIYTNFALEPDYLEELFPKLF